MNDTATHWARQCFNPKCSRPVMIAKTLDPADYPTHCSPACSEAKVKAVPLAHRRVPKSRGTRREGDRWADGHLKTCSCLGCQAMMASVVRRHAIKY